MSEYSHEFVERNGLVIPTSLSRMERQSIQKAALKARQLAVVLDG